MPTHCCLTRREASPKTISGDHELEGEKHRSQRTCSDGVSSGVDAVSSTLPDPFNWSGRGEGKMPSVASAAGVGVGWAEARSWVSIFGRSSSRSVIEPASGPFCGRGELSCATPLDMGCIVSSSGPRSSSSSRAPSSLPSIMELISEMFG